MPCLPLVKICPTVNVKYAGWLWFLQCLVIPAITLTFIILVVTLHKTQALPVYAKKKILHTHAEPCPNLKTQSLTFLVTLLEDLRFFVALVKCVVPAPVQRWRGYFQFRWLTLYASAYFGPQNINIYVFNFTARKTLFYLFFCCWKQYDIYMQLQTAFLKSWKMLLLLFGPQK